MDNLKLRESVKKKLLIVANRLPVRFEKTDKGMTMHQSEGGLATGLASLSSDYQKEWIGWPGVYVANEQEQQEVESCMSSDYHPVFLTETEIDRYYKGFSNETLWPLSHYFMKYTHFNNENWEEYKCVNEKFCQKILEVAGEDDLIWVHDYHLMLVPGMLREKLQQNNPIGFFLHIPFPSFELFRTLPWRKELLNGILGADLIGFHTFEYNQNFTHTVYRILGYDNRLGAIHTENHLAYTDVFPMGINFEKFHQGSKSKEVLEQLNTFRSRFGNVKLIVSVDRLDYTKGIPNRLRAFNRLLEKFPELKEKVSLIMLAVPSRDDVEEYKHLKEEVDEIVGNINGRHSTLSWTPIYYFYRSVPFNQLVAFYSLADICFVTPLRDGMNLVAKEYIASKSNSNGVLILSEMAGSAIELDGALLVNPNDENDMMTTLYKALNMNATEQELRLEKLQEQVRTNSVEKWGAAFTTKLNMIYEQAKQMGSQYLKGNEIAELCAAYAHADKRLLILDYDGTLTPFFTNPHDAKPDEELKDILEELGRIATVVLVSGRDHFTMDEWFGDLNIHLVAEHGIWTKENGEWKQAKGISSAWKKDLYPVIHDYVEKTPGSFIEEKAFSLAFHYRRCDNWLAEMRAPQLISALGPICKQNALNILDGNKVVEIRLAGIDKGNAASKWLATDDWEFVMCIGDDTTDEDMFNVMPDTAYTIKVGSQYSKAKKRITNCTKVRDLLKHLITYQNLRENNRPAEVMYRKAM
jgi:trehalose 6-phosphate synthase/phosphatase